MNSKILLITDLVKLAGLIAKTNDKFFELKNDRDDLVIQSRRSEKSVDRQSKAVLDAQTKRDTASALAATLPDGPLKDRQLGIVETQKARLFNLNLPAETKTPDEVAEIDIEKGEFDVLVTYYEGVLSDLNTRQDQLQNP
jgi:hypothetical protein